MSSFFFFNDTATTEIYTLSLQRRSSDLAGVRAGPGEAKQFRPILGVPMLLRALRPLDRKSTRLNSSHLVISYAVFCLKKKKIREAAVRLRHEPARDTQPLRRSSLRWTAY